MNDSTSNGINPFRPFSIKFIHEPLLKAVKNSKFSQCSSTVATAVIVTVNCSKMMCLVTEKNRSTTLPTVADFLAMRSVKKKFLALKYRGKNGRT